MRVSPFVAVAAIALVGCAAPQASPPPTPTPTPTATPTPSPTPSNVTIGIHLHRQPDPPRKCLVTIDDAGWKHATAYTGFQVIWEVTKNDCGDVKKGNRKALGLRFLKDKPKQQPAPWFHRCSTLPFVPGEFTKGPQFGCSIPPVASGTIEGKYEYEIDGDFVEPLDPELDVKRGG
jgi:hypothetical protein